MIHGEMHDSYFPPNVWDRGKKSTPIRVADSHSTSMPTKTYSFKKLLRFQLPVTLGGDLDRKGLSSSG